MGPLGIELLLIEFDSLHVAFATHPAGFEIPEINLQINNMCIFISNPQNNF